MLSGKSWSQRVIHDDKIIVMENRSVVAKGKVRERVKLLRTNGREFLRGDGTVVFPDHGDVYLNLTSHKIS